MTEQTIGGFHLSLMSILKKKKQNPNKTKQTNKQSEIMKTAWDKYLQ